MEHPNLSLTCVVSMPFEENTYIVHLKGRSECLVVDPGLEPYKILTYLTDANLVPASILNTHGHSDHIAGNGCLKERFPSCRLVIGHQEVAKLSDPSKNLSAAFGLALVSPAADLLVHDGDVIHAAGMDLEVLETPGHSVGHVVFVWKGGVPWVVFGGDVLFHGSIGRTDFPDGSFDALRAAIHKKLFTMPDGTLILPGHGPPTTIGHEKQNNPFVGAPSGYRMG